MKFFLFFIITAFLSPVFAEHSDEEDHLDLQTKNIKSFEFDVGSSLYPEINLTTDKIKDVLKPKIEAVGIKIDQTNNERSLSADVTTARIPNKKGLAVTLRLSYNEYCVNERIKQKVRCELWSLDGGIMVFETAEQAKEYVLAKLKEYMDSFLQEFKK